MNQPKQTGLPSRNEERKELQEAISRILFEIDDLLLQKAWQIENEYQVLFGELERNIWKAQCEAARLKRGMELIRARMNRNEVPDLEEVERILDLEFEEYEKKLEEFRRKIEEARFAAANSHELDEKDSRKLKKLYFYLMKRLHPDLHPQQTEKEMRMLQLVMNAYSKGDLDTLESLALAWTLDELPEEEPEDDSLEELKEKLEQAKKRKEEILSSYPFYLEPWLSDPLKSQRTEQLIAQLAHNQSLADEMKIRYRNLLKEPHETVCH